MKKKERKENKSEERESKRSIFNNTSKLNFISITREIEWYILTFLHI